MTGDSVLVTGQASGQTTIQATRPDALTGKPVVIGLYKDNASAFGPFSVNTTAPTALRSSGDCWQKGALPSALTPDLQPGDTVTVKQAARFGGQPTSTSVEVTAQATQGAVGPIPTCATIAPFARNAVTSRPDRVADGPITVAGVAQPFATNVSLSATDGTRSAASVAVTPAQDGSWSATIPADDVAGLRDGALAVTPAFEVPDVSTGAIAHIAAGGFQVTKSVTGATTPPGAKPNGSGKGSAALRVRSLRLSARIGIGDARRKGIRTSFVVPAGAHVVRVQLKRGNKLLVQQFVRAGHAGSRQAVRLRGPRLRRAIRSTGRYRVAVSAGTSRTQLGRPVSGGIVIR